MKFFTKYIPVPGEITQGDWFINNNDDETCGNILQCTAVDFQSYADSDWTDNCKKVKLFLCSRDIQVGDEVYNSNIPEYGIRKVRKILNGEAEFKGDSYLDNSFISNLYKVIGEVSPNAIWVKEGMEFNTYKLMYITPKDMDITRAWYEKLLKNDPERAALYSPVVYLPCPTCNTFH